MMGGPGLRSPVWKKKKNKQNRLGHLPSGYGGGTPSPKPPAQGLRAMLSCGRIRTREAGAGGGLKVSILGAAMEGVHPQTEPSPALR